MVRIKIKVIPKSGRQKIVTGEEPWRISLKSAPEDGKANKELVRILAKFLHVVQSEVLIVRGSASREKTVEISGITRDELLERIEKHG